MKILSNALLKLIESARILGLGESDLSNASYYLINNEFWLCFDTIITQMYEYDVEINDGFYGFVSKIGEMMNLEQNRYDFMKELIRHQSNIPKPVRDKLAQIIASFMDPNMKTQ